MDQIVHSERCARWNAFVENVQKAQEKLFDLYQRITDPPPANVREEAKKLLTDLATILSESEHVLKAGRLWDGTPVDAFTENALVQLARTVSASAPEIQRVFHLTDLTLGAVQQIGNLWKSIAGMAKARTDRKEMEFVDSACIFLEKEWNRLCTSSSTSLRSINDPVLVSNGPANQQLPPEFEKLQTSVEDRLSRYSSSAARMEQRLLGKTPVLNALSAVSGSKAISAGNRFDVQNIFYDYTVPALRMCLMKRALSLYPAITKDHRCGRFYCGRDRYGTDHPLLKLTTQDTTAQFCRVLAEYKRTEDLYGTGFGQALGRAAGRTGKDRKLDTFCPAPSPVRRLPPLPVDDRIHQE
ncbi:MAG: hypothetical protein HY537_03160 [Deltaproteobacteria bacterium]|nr:hypothetical protein [Deltaproteobacteria bacterium]